MSRIPEKRGLGVSGGLEQLFRRRDVSRGVFGTRCAGSSADAQPLGWHLNGPGLESLHPLAAPAAVLVHGAGVVPEVWGAVPRCCGTGARGDGSSRLLSCRWTPAKVVARAQDGLGSGPRSPGLRGRLAPTGFVLFLFRDRF